MIALATQNDAPVDDLGEETHGLELRDSGPRELVQRSSGSVSRMCAVTRQSLPVDSLLRFVVAPSGEVVADLKRRLPGRGLWITASKPVLEQAVKRGAFQKGFKREVTGGATLVARTEAQLVHGACDALAMAGKAGQAVSGAGRVSDLIKSGEAAALIHATDGAEDGIRKLDALIGDRAIRVIRALTSDELDLALGRSNVIHAALRAGPASKTFLSRCETLEQFRGSGSIDGEAKLRRQN